MRRLEQVPVPVKDQEAPEPEQQAQKLDRQAASRQAAIREVMEKKK